METRQQKKELIEIRKLATVVFFGQGKIPDITKKFFDRFEISFFRQLEKTVRPYLKSNGLTDGKRIRVELPEISEFLKIPDSDFVLSEKVCKYLSLLFPGL
ncbi:MAG: hypothetical protein MJZ37_01145 [Bacilli bacterium]|nr:hypothetical protein [Bacilli bacterium]